jgi:putative ABC transport system permease protein
VTGKLVLENLKHRPMRSLLSILLIAVPVTLILTLVGLSHGMTEDTARRTRGIGADIVVRPPGSTLLTLSGGITEKFVGWLAQQPHVKMAMGIINQPVQSVFLGATGIDLDQYKKMNGGFRYVAGGPFRQPGEVLIDEYYANQSHAKVGSTITILNKPWRVSGIIENGQAARIVMPFDVLQDLSSNNGKVSQIYLKLDNQALTSQVVKDLKDKLTDYQIYPMEEYLSLLNPDSVPALHEFTVIVVVIGVVIGFAVVCLSMYMAVLQRTREIGILKSLGSSKFFILRIILTEAALLGIGGTILGILMSYGAYWALRTFVPAFFQMSIVKSWWPIAGGITLVAAQLGALYPGLSAAAQDPIEALAYE